MKWRVGAIQEFGALTRNKKLVIPSYSSSDSILEIDLCYLPQPNTSLQVEVGKGFHPFLVLCLSKDSNKIDGTLRLISSDPP